MLKLIKLFVLSLTVFATSVYADSSLNLIGWADCKSQMMMLSINNVQDTYFQINATDGSYHEVLPAGNGQVVEVYGQVFCPNNEISASLVRNYKTDSTGSFQIPLN